jgi:uncharacterized protein (DUF58 family)
VTTAALREGAERLTGGLPPLLLAAQHLAAVALPGAHGRRRVGMGAEFWQFRAAQGFDSHGRIDWRRSGRGDDLFVRETEWQGAQRLAIWVDAGAAMRFSSARDLPTKAERAQLLAMAAAVLALQAGERVGLADPALAARTGRAQAALLAQALGRAEEAERSIPQMDHLRAGGQALFVSDFLGDLAGVEHALDRAARSRIGGLMVQVLDPAEDAFPYRGRTRFEAMSGGMSHETLRADDLRDAYRERLAARRDRLALLARQAGWDFGTLSTGSSPAAGLLWIWQMLGGRR